jgi:hypothetical protein
MRTIEKIHTHRASFDVAIRPQIPVGLANNKTIATTTATHRNNNNTPQQQQYRNSKSTTTMKEAKKNQLEINFSSPTPNT